MIVVYYTPDLVWTVAIVGAVVATVTEALPWRIDDNLSVPLVSGAAMMIVQKILLSL